MTTETRYQSGYERADCTRYVGQVLTSKRGTVVVTHCDEPIDTDDGQKPWSQEYSCRPATNAEITADEHRRQIAYLKRQRRILSAEPDDERDRERIEAKRIDVQSRLDALQAAV